MPCLLEPCCGGAMRTPVSREYKYVGKTEITLMISKAKIVYVKPFFSDGSCFRVSKAEALRAIDRCDDECNYGVAMCDGNLFVE